MTNEEKIQKLNEIVKGSDNIVFFGGAGVSTESGIPDFRSQDGLYHQQYDYPPEEILSHTFYETMPEEFFRFYKNKILLPGANAKPNAAHKKLAQWEQEGSSRLSSPRTSTVSTRRPAAKTSWSSMGACCATTASTATPSTMSTT